MNIAISRVHFPVSTLGPGTRIGIWFQGCSLKCSGCTSIDTWAANKNLIEMEALETLLLDWLPQATGVTISGGEPFEQFEQLKHLLKFIKSHSDADAFAYSGFRFDCIREKVALLAPTLDALMSEPFDNKQTQTLALRGSDNQRLHLLTALGRARFSHLDRPQTQVLEVDAMVDRQGVWMAGIAEQKFLQLLDSAMSAQGFEITHTQSTSARDET